MGNETRPRPSAWSPIREPLFRSLWIAAVISYTGSWMRSTGAGWLMASLTPSPLMVSLVQAATSLPVFFVILPAGALADIVDRRRLLLATQGWMLGAATLLGVLTLTQKITPWMLLGIIFLLGVGVVMNDPAWQAITHEVVSADHFHAAVALNSAGYNAARAVGPAIGGLIIAAAGTGIVFLLSAASFLGVIAFLYRWRRPRSPAAPKSQVMPAMRAGFQFLRQAPAVKAVLVRTGVFSFAASALLALLPVIALPFGSVGYGALLGFFGLGALSGAVLLPFWRTALSVNSIVGWATVLYALAIYAAGILHSFWALSLVLLVAGTAWITIVASLNVSAQTSSAAWVRARMLSVYVLVLQGGMAVGSACWGAAAGKYGIGTTMVLAAITLVAGLLTARRFRLEPAGIGRPPAVEA